jgi:KDO2-lipid IV(A) lauroyltransferase
MVGPLLGISRKAERNLERAFPHINKSECDKIILAMWDNLGRIIAEYPHIKYLARERVALNESHILDDIFKFKKPVIFIGGHIGNWEVNCAALLLKYNQKVDLTYRALNNPYADKLIENARTLNGHLKAYPKSRSSGKFLIDAMKQGRYLGILIDQKYNEGVAVPFFSIPAMTNPVSIQLCQKYDGMLVPVRNVRTRGANFTLKIHKPLDLFKDGEARPLEDVIQDAHTLLEEWIREEPAQWLWLHRRWDSEGLKSS